MNPKTVRTDVQTQRLIRALRRRLHASGDAGIHTNSLATSHEERLTRAENLSHAWTDALAGSDFLEDFLEDLRWMLQQVATAITATQEILSCHHSPSRNSNAKTSSEPQ